jgi:hypothetical protein
MAVSLRRPGVVVPARIDPSGLTGPTRGESRGPGWRRVAPGWYVPTSTESAALEQRIVEAVVGCGPGAAVTGWAALAWAGGRWFSGLAPDGRTPLPVPVALDDERIVRPRQGVRVSEDWLFDGDVIELDGLPITIPERSVTFEARRARTLVKAVQVIDMAAADDLVDIVSVATYTEQLIARPGLRRLRMALGWADENVWSPQEDTMRLTWGQARPGVRLLCNAPIFDHDGRHLLTPDLLDPERGVAGEYQGAVHLDGAVRRRDLNRDSLYRDLGIEQVEMMSGDRHDTIDFHRRLDAAYRRASAPSTGWTLEQPSWWVDTSTVAARRSLDTAARAVWLRRRAA